MWPKGHTTTYIYIASNTHETCLHASAKFAHRHKQRKKVGLDPENLLVVKQFLKQGLQCK